MGRNFAIVIGAALIAAAVMITNHWELGFAHGNDSSTTMRMNRWTGTISICVPDPKSIKQNSFAGMELSCTPQ